MTARTPQGRRYGSAHQRERARLLAALAAAGWLPCARCGQPMTAADAVHLDHVDDEAGRYLGLSHAWCNIGASNQPSRRRRWQWTEPDRVPARPVAQSW